MLLLVLLLVLLLLLVLVLLLLLLLPLFVCLTLKAPLPLTPLKLASYSSVACLVEDFEGLGQRRGPGEHHQPLSPSGHLDAHRHLLRLLAFFSQLQGRVSSRKGRPR